NAAQVHVRLRLCQDHFLAGNFSAARQRLALWPVHTNPVAIREFIYRHETQVVRRPLILRIGIPKSDNKPHNPRFAGVHAFPGLGTRKAATSSSPSSRPFRPWAWLLPPRPLRPPLPSCPS